jgi:hypothetical protein
MVGKTHKHRIGTGASQDLSIARGDHTSALALERVGDDGRPATSSAGINDLIHEVHELVRESHGNLLAHPIMVAKW